MTVMATGRPQCFQLKGLETWRSERFSLLLYLALSSSLRPLHELCLKGSNHSINLCNLIAWI